MIRSVYKAVKITKDVNELKISSNPTQTKKPNMNPATPSEQEVELRVQS